MKRLWVAAALAPLSFAATASAQVTISNSTSTPLFTATANNNTPADIIIASGGSVSPTTAGTASAQVAAVTLNSNNNVTNNGSISFQNLNYTTGIQGAIQPGGFNGSITNLGSITLNETASQHVNATNGIADGIYVNGVYQTGENFAQGTNRFGIQTIGGLLNGVISNGNSTTAGSITIVGENSAGISIGAGGLNAGAPATTAIADFGTITVTGDNSFGIHALGPINGGVSVSGAMSVTGQNSVGLALDQGASGSVDIASSITVGLVDGPSTEILSGLDGGELVVKANAGLIVPGQPVESTEPGKP